MLKCGKGPGHPHTPQGSPKTLQKQTLAGSSGTLNPKPEPASLKQGVQGPIQNRDSPWLERTDADHYLDESKHYLGEVGPKLV